MSTAKNQPEKSMSTRRSAKSTERETTTLLNPLTPTPEKKEYPLLYLCSKCNTILSNAECLFRIIQLDETVFLFPTQTDTFVLNTAQVLVASESEYDQFCAYYLVMCAKCNNPLGKYYLSTTEKINEAKNTLVIPENKLLIYDIKTSKIMTPAAKKAKQGEITTAKKKVVSSSGRDEKENKEHKEHREPRSAMKEVTFAQQLDKTIKYQSPVNTRIEEERKLDERSPNPLLESDEKDIHQIKQVENSFAEMRGVLTNFAQLLEQFDLRLASSEKTVMLINNTLNDIYKQLNVKELIDLSE